MTVAKAYAATSATSGLKPSSLDRREPGSDDVEIDIEFCGLCHSDVHTVRGEWGTQHWPITPGHEIIGTVTRVGSQFTRFAVGDLVGVGCMVDSCRKCASCVEGFEQYCEVGMVGTYGAVDRRHDDQITQGGYSSSIVVDKNYVLRIPQALAKDEVKAAVAPLLCAGITTYSPLRYFDTQPDDAVGIVGLGVLGHMAVKLAKAMGAKVTVFTTNPAKAEAARELGAERVVVSSDDAQMTDSAKSLDLIIDTVAAPHNINDYLRMLRRDGAIVQLGLPEGMMPPIDPGQLIMRRLVYSGSLIGGIAQTQEMLDFCAEHGVVSDIEVIAAEHLNHAYDRMVAGDVKYRFVLDTATL